MKKNYLKIANGLKAIANELNDDAKAKLEEIAAAIVALGEEADNDGKEEIKARLAQLQADLDKVQAETAEEVANRIQKLRDEMTKSASVKDVRDKFTPEVRKAIANAILDARYGVKNTMAAIEAVCKSNDIAVRTKNSVSGLTFAEIIDYALQLKQEDNDEIFDALYKTKRTKFFYGEIDSTKPNNIAKQWAKNSETQKLEQELALNGKAISTAYIYKLQSLANEDLDDAREAGQEAELLRDIRDELTRAVKGLAVRAIFVGDTYNPSGSKVTVFETIGTKIATDLFTTVINPATPQTVTLADLRKAAAAVKTEKKWAVVTSATKLALAEYLSAAGATPRFLTDAELAEQIGVDRVIDKDFIGEATGLHAVIFDPSEYWVKEKNVIDTPFPEYRDNRQGYIYEINMGGAIHGLKSTAVLREA